MSDPQRAAREAAEKAGDPDRLLPGEDPRSPHRDDAEHWIRVYRELRDYKDRLLRVTQEALEQMPEERARSEVAETDRQLVLVERDRFVRRLEYWERRLLELT